jgi:hypothetical protein
MSYRICRPIFECAARLHLESDSSGSPTGARHARGSSAMPAPENQTARARDLPGTRAAHAKRSSD